MPLRTVSKAAWESLLMPACFCGARLHTWTLPLDISNGLSAEDVEKSGEQLQNCSLHMVPVRLEQCESLG